MHSSKLVTVLKSFGQEELQQFEAFLRSPYLHPEFANTQLHNLWHYLKEGLSLEKKGYFDRDQVYQAVFSHPEFYKSKLEKLMSQLYALVKSFLVLQQVQKRVNKKTELLYLMEAFSDRNLTNLFNQAYKKIQADPIDLQYGHSDLFYENFTVQKRVSEYQILDNNRKTDLNLPRLHFHLDAYYLIQKLEMACQLLTRHLFIFPMDIGESLKYLDLLIAQLSPEHRTTPILELYIGAYHLLKSLIHSDNDEHFLNFNRLLEKHQHFISHDQQKILQTLNRNYTLFKYQKGDASYLKHAFVLYKEHLEIGFLYQDGKILPSLFSNVVVAGLRLGELDWVYQFIQNHKNRLAGINDSEIIVQYNLGQYYFYVPDYDLALEHLAPTYEDQFYKLAARRLELKILHEKESELLDYKLSAFKTFIYRLPEDSVHFKNRLANKRFVNLLIQIRRVNTYKNDSRIAKLLGKAKAPEYLADKEWIMEKLEGLR